MKPSRLLTEFLDFIFVPRCLACGQMLIRPSHVSGIHRCFCEICTNAVLPLEPSHCPRCAEPFSASTRTHLCGTCLSHPPPFQAIHTGFEYGGPLAQAIARYKYQPAPFMARELAGLLPTPPVNAVDLVMPVPLHPKKLTQRGFNQSALLARFLSRKMQRPCDFSALRRTRHGDAQVGKSKQERIRNMKTAFHVPDRRHDIAGRHILLVDDVVTTTATVRAAANALKIQGKAASVQVVCLGRSASRR